MDFSIIFAVLLGGFAVVLFIISRRKSQSESVTSSNTSSQQNFQETSNFRTSSQPISPINQPSQDSSSITNNSSKSNSECCGGNSSSCACSGEGLELGDSNLIAPSCCGNSSSSACSTSCSSPKDSIKILYGTQTGTTLEYANKLASQAKALNYANVQVINLSLYDLDDLCDEPLVVFIVSTYTNGLPPDSCIPFFNLLDAHSNDWRVDKGSFKDVKYSVFGIGHSIYGPNFNKAARDLDKIMQHLSADRILTVGLGDNGAGEELMDTFMPWSKKFWSAVQASNIKSEDGSSPRVAMKTSEEPDEDLDDSQAAEPLVDVEDLGKMVKSNVKPIVKRRGKKPVKQVKQVEFEEKMEEDDGESSAEEDDTPTFDANGTKIEKEMLTPSLRKSLEKQGYRLLGSHSGVKLCRWTKAMLRGRGGCYKHTFYGIKSYQCMEMTPSLACANKCVFCWRHHKNPVGTEWKWKVDKASFLLEEAIKQHQSMIKQMKGVPGVSKERFDEAFTIKHCALSLVGEPITYPEINDFVDLLHGQGISSFMVTNAQFPDKIDELKPVTQLYLSIDAATKDSLKRIDRPIFPDFWERFLACMDSLALKGQRTVYRLTLVKEWNMEEISNYATLIGRGKPSFVEVKGVTYCGTSKASTLTMQNVPFHQEVINFATALCNTPELKEDYELAVEHEHSCGVLIAHKKFKVNGQWNTWIDYPKFHELVKSGREFSAIDYMEPTPYWALIGAEERGFDPEETRFKRNKPYQNAGC